MISGDFPGGPGVKNPPSNAGDMGSISGGGTKIPHAPGQLSLCTATREKPVAATKILPAATKTQCSQRKKSCI